MTMVKKHFIVINKKMFVAYKSFSGVLFFFSDEVGFDVWRIKEKTQIHYNLDKVKLINF